MLLFGSPPLHRLLSLQAFFEGPHGASALDLGLELFANLLIDVGGKLEVKEALRTGVDYLGSAGIAVSPINERPSGNFPLHRRHEVAGELLDLACHIVVVHSLLSSPREGL